MYPVAMYLAFVFLSGLWAVLPPFWLLVRKQLPSNKIHVLDVVLQDTDNVFRSYVEDGVLDGVAATDLHARLIGLHERAYPLRLRALQATTLWEDLMHMRHGLSHEMARLIKDVRSLRARISAVSYVELQNVQLRTIDGKEVAQLCGALTDRCLPAPIISHNLNSESALCSVDISANCDGDRKPVDDVVAALV